MTSFPHDASPDRSHEEFTRLYSECSDWLYCYLVSLLRRPVDAEEVLQETAQLLWQKFDRYEPNTEFRAWACRIAHFKAMKFRDRQNRAPAAFSDIFLAAVEEEAVVMADQLDVRLEALTGCVEALAADDRQLLEARYTRDVSVAHLAENQGQSTHAVYRSLSSIYDSLFRCIERTIKGRDA